MHLYDLPLQSPSSINVAVLGNFSGTKAQEVIVSRGSSTLELLRPDYETGKMVSVISHDVFGVIRSATAFRLLGSAKDYIALGSDSGRIVVLEYNPDKNLFEKVHQETFGKSGCRRIVAGQYIAADPKGRAIMIAAIEKQKIVYVMNRDSESNLTISSPLEANKANTLLSSLVGLDNGYENPLFACLEVDYTDADEEESGLDATEKVLTYYEMDLGLNHIVRRWSEPVDNRSNMLISIPGSGDGPGGVLVCSENHLTWKHQGYKEVRIAIPRRKSPLENPEKGLLIISHTTHKTKNEFFVLLQSEHGDVYKLTFAWNKDKVDGMSIKYLDTVPLATSLCLFRRGYLFVPSEFGNHMLYQVESLGDDDDEPSFTSEEFQEDEFVYFEPRELRNFAIVDEIETLNPILDCKVLNLGNEETPQFYTLCGRGEKSSIKVLRHGLEVSEIAVSELPAGATATWTVKRNASNEFDEYIVVSFSNATIVLAVGETVEEIQDSGFLGSVPSLYVGQLGIDSLIQVHPKGIRYIKSDQKIVEWKAPANKPVRQVSCNGKQVVVSIGASELVYFELDDAGKLNEFQHHKTLAADIISLSIGKVQEGRVRNRFLAVGLADSTVRILSLDPEDCLQPLGMQALSSKPHSLLITDSLDFSSDNSQATTYLMIGLENGVMVKLMVDMVTGMLSDARTRFLGPKPIKLFDVKVESGNAVLALSTRPWLQYTFQNRSYLAPLFYGSLEHASAFASEPCPNGIVAVTGSTLRIITIEKISNTFNQQSIALKHTPRRFLIHPEFRNFVLIESDYNVISEKEKKKLLVEKLREPDDMDADEGVRRRTPAWMREGPVRCDNGTWASCLRIINPYLGQTSFLYDFEDNEAAYSVTTCGFHSRPGESFLVVGTAKDVILSPRVCSVGYLYVFRFFADGTTVELVHKTEIDDVPSALCGYQGRLLVGSGRCLRIYDLGKKKVLRKCETKAFPNCIIQIQVQNNRIVVSDIQESVHLAMYRHDVNQFFIFADDTLPRWLTCCIPLDQDTYAGADKFGNFFVIRLPKHVSIDLEEDPTGNRLLVDKPSLNGAPHKFDHIVHYHVGDIITSLNKTGLVFGGREVLIYTTLQGGIGCFVPFVSREDVDFFQLLEAHLRNENSSLVGRDHLWYRSYYMPVKNVVDGSLCEQFSILPGEKRAEISASFDRSPAELIKKIQDMRTNVAF